MLYLPVIYVLYGCVLITCHYMYIIVYELEQTLELQAAPRISVGWPTLSIDYNVDKELLFVYSLSYALQEMDACALKD